MEANYQPGDIVREKYRIVGILGEGGTAITYEAVDRTQSDLPIAIKVLSFIQTKDWKLVELFEREAKVLKNLHHPRIPQYLDYFSIDTETDRQFLLVQELVPGKSLGDLVEQGWYFQEKEVKDIAQQILEILIYLHAFQPAVIHRDIKPHNIIRTEAGEIYLVDLGAVQDVYRNTLTRGATFVGTIDYMSPEQLRGHASFASDLYSLGCTLLYLLTRRSPSELPLQRMKINFRSSLEISEQFADWLEKILEPALEDRFSSTTEALERLLKEEKLSSIESPKDSSIEITTSHNYFCLNIPVSRDLALKDVLAIIFIFLVSLAMLAGGAFSTIPFLIIELGLWMFFIIPITYDMFVSTKLEIDKDNFVLEHDYKITKRAIAGKTAAIKSITIDERYNLITKDFEKYCCLIAKKKYAIGRNLSLSEQKWIVEQVKLFLHEIDPEKFPLSRLDNWFTNIFKSK